MRYEKERREGERYEKIEDRERDNETKRREETK